MVQNRFNCWLTVNRICNYRCPWCYAEGTKYRPEDSMTLELAEKIIDFLAEIGTVGVYFIGGEPLMWPHLMKANAYAKARGLDTILVTNGSLLTDPNLFQEICDNPFTNIGLSIKAGNREQHKAITGHDNFDEYLETIRLLKKSGMTFNGSIVLNRLLKDNLVECVEQAIQAGLKSVWIDMCSPIIDGLEVNDEFMVHPAEAAKIIQLNYDQIHDLTSGELGIHASNPLCLWDKDLIELLKSRNQIITSCFVVDHSGIVFDPQGSILPCNSLCDVKLGQFGKDFHDNASFEDYWTNDLPAEFHKRITTYPSLTCKTCKDYNECTGGCPLNWFALKPDAVIPAR